MVIPPAKAGCTTPAINSSGRATLLSLRIASQHAEEIGQLRQVPERLLGNRVVHVTQKVQVKKILPRLAAQGARFNLGEVQIAQRERAQGPEQSSWNIARREYQRCLPARP